MKRSDLPSFWQTPWNAAGCCKQRHSGLTKCHGSLGPMFRTQAAQIRCWHIEVIEVTSMNKVMSRRHHEVGAVQDQLGEQQKVLFALAQCQLGNTMASSTFEHIIRVGTKNFELWAELRQDELPASLHQVCVVYRSQTTTMEPEVRFKGLPRHDKELWTCNGRIHLWRI